MGRQDIISALIWYLAEQPWERGRERKRRRRRTVLFSALPSWTFRFYYCFGSWCRGRDGKKILNLEQSWTNFFLSCLREMFLYMISKEDEKCICIPLCFKPNVGYFCRLCHERNDNWKMSPAVLSVTVTVTWESGANFLFLTGCEGFNTFFL